MRQEHCVGEKLFVDYAGQTVPVVDRETGGERQAQIFVAVLGAPRAGRGRVPQLLRERGRAVSDGDAGGEGGYRSMAPTVRCCDSAFVDGAWFASVSWSCA